VPSKTALDDSCFDPRTGEIVSSRARPLGSLLFNLWRFMHLPLLVAGTSLSLSQIGNFESGLITKPGMHVDLVTDFRPLSVDDVRSLLEKYLNMDKLSDKLRSYIAHELQGLTE
jgi:hypothetical protein